MFGVLILLPACNSNDGDGIPSAKTNVTVIADLPSNVSRLINDNCDVQAQLEYNGSSQKMNFIIDGTAEKTIENFDLASISVGVLLSVDVQGTLVELARSTRSASTQAGSQEVIKISAYEYLDTDNDGFSNLIEVVNGSDYADPGSSPDGVVNTTISSANYSIERSKISELNHSPNSESYSVNNTRSAIYSVAGGISRTLKQSSGVALYEINT